ncbi:autotransporter outer membrane beta-barrel domain-containing protein [Yersinia rohdei]|uniref:autotransporter outer membrane beta-barrel domain-containing protein n=1 Tax=Yersinia rohdei TaxID=29485 RepID=UPI0011A07910|nr:autotransporter outer membrane beta-barrel domain-containing protein [Yersinia rohdei]
MNTIFKVIWNISLNVWVAVGELAKGKQKSKTVRRVSASQTSPDAIAKSFPAKIGLLAAAIAGLLSAQPAFAITSAECASMGTSCVAVGTAAALNTALSSGTATTILLLNDITMNGNITVNQVANNRKDLVIDGGGFSLTTGSYSFNFSNQVDAAWGGAGSFTLSNLSALNSSTAGGNNVISMPGAASAINIIFDNIGSTTDSMLAVLGNIGAGGTPNLNSQLVLGNFTQPLTLTFGTNHQLAQASNIKFTGHFDLTATTGSYPAVFWTNSANNYSLINFSSTADVSITTPQLTNGSGGNGYYQYTLEDGAKFTLNSDQYVFDIANNGLKIGSYDATTGFGEGAVVKLATQNKGVITSGHGISNTGGSNANGMGNGAAGSVDVIYNLATGSSINQSAINSIGILANKTGATNSSGIYISSGATIKAGTAGISSSHAGNGKIILENKATGGITAGIGISATNSGSASIDIANKGVITATTGMVASNTGAATASVDVANSGTINSTSAGITISSTNGQRVNVVNTGGTINATGGTGINVLANALLNMVGGTITTTGIATGITFAGTNNSHVLTDLILNMNGTGAAFSKATGVNLTLNHIIFNTVTGTVFNSLAGLTFADSANGRNEINVTGAGTGINSAGGVDLSTAYLNINIDGSAGTGLKVSDGASALTTIGANTQINATGATAISFTGTTAKTLTNNSTINGAVTFAGTAANTINNNGILNGTLTAGSGNDSLVLGSASQSNGAINLGDGNNNVTIQNGAQVTSITTGSGDDIFTINNMTLGSTYLGLLNAGAGANTLNFNTSMDSLASDTSLQGFANINLTDSQITLAAASNVGSGVMNIDGGSELLFSNTFNGILDASLGHVASGDGSAIVNNGANVRLSQASAFTGDWQINQGGTLTASNSNQLGTTAIALNGTLNLNGVATSNNALTGTGLLNIDTANNTFNFGVNTGTAFAGSVDIANSTFVLGGGNTGALSNASFIASGGTLVAVNSGNQAIGNLTLNGASVAFAAGSKIDTGTLAVNADSIIKVAPDLTTGGNLLDQDTTISTQLIDSNNTLTAIDLARLTLQDLLGNNLGADALADVIQGGNKVAESIYNYALSGVGGGLSLTAGLTRMILLSGETLTLTSQGAVDINKLLTAQLTGSGNLAIGADNSEMTLTNASNNYTGNTSVNGGILNLGSNNALGQTSALNTAAGTSTNLNGHSQNVGALTNAGTVTLGSGGVLNSGLLTNSNILDVTGATLNLSAGGTSTTTGGLTGNGTLNIDGGDLVLSAANSGLSGQTNIASSAAATLNGSGTLGSSALHVLGDLNLNGANAALANVLSGTGNINTNAAVTLTGNNSFSGAHHIGATGVLTVGQASNLGTATVGLDTATSHFVLNGVSGAVANVLRGVAGSTVDVTNGANTSLTGNNSNFLGQYALAGNSKLSVGSTANLGASASIALAGAQDILALSGFNGTFGNTVTGSGVLQVTDGANATLTSSNGVADTVTVDIANATLNLDDMAQFNHELTGNGTLNVATNLASTAFNFGSAVGGAFSGMVNLSNSTFALTADNTAALVNATLQLSANNVTTVGTTDRTIQGLDLSGGTLIFDGAAPQSQASGVLNVTNLALNSGTVSVTGTDSWDNNNPVVSPNLSILEQDRGNIMLALINAGTVTGNVNGLDLSINGTPVISGSQAVLSTIKQGGVAVANATHNYGLTTNGGTGLYVNYSLSALELLTDGNDAFLLTTEAGAGANREFNTAVSGIGGLQVDASNGALTLANGSNSHRGTTTVNAGTLILGANNALGQTSLLNVLSGASTNLNGHSQTVGALTNAGTVTLGSGGVLNSGLLTNSHILDVTGAILNLSAGGTSTTTGGLTGNGTLNIDGGDLVLSAANSGLSGQTNIASSAAATLNGSGTLGSSAIHVLGDLNLNGANAALANVLSGTGNINTDAAVTLTGNNSFSGAHHIGATGVLTVGQASNLGTATVGLDTATSHFVLNGVSGAVANVLRGVAGSTVDVTNGANTSLTGDNSNFFGQYALAGNSKLSVGSTANLGASASIALAGAQDILALSGFNGTFDNTVTGSGVLQVTDGANATLTSSNGVADTVTVDIANATLNLDDMAQFNHELTGNGTLNVATNLASTAFNFGSAVGGAFSGMVNLSNFTFDLDGMNTSALTNATLKLSSGSLTSVADGTQNIGGLVMNGGTMLFNNLVDHSGIISSEGTFAANSINTTGGGTIRVNLPATLVPSLDGLPVMQLDEGEIIVKLGTGAATGTGQELTLADENDNPISAIFYQDIYNSGGSSVAAVGSFNYGLTTGNDYDGLYVNYGLKAVALQGTGNDALVLTATLANNGKQSNDLSVQISGSGDLAFVSANDGSTASLSNSTNSYTGATWVRSGNLRLDADSALGQTSLLAMSNATNVDLNGTEQRVRQLTTETGSTLNFNDGKLSVTEGGQVDGALSGSGELALTGGLLSITQGNSGFTGSTDIASGATAHLYQAQGLGSGAINNNGMLNLDNTRGVLSNNLTGSDGNVQLMNRANIQLAGDNSGYFGVFSTNTGTALTVNSAQNLGDGSVDNSGELILDTAATWTLTNNIAGSGALIKRGSGAVTIEGDSVSAGLTTIENGLLQLGSAPATSIIALEESPLARSLSVTLASTIANLTSDVNIATTGSLGGYGKVTGNVENSGRLLMPNALTGGDFGTFTIDGNYTGNNGTVVFNTVLAGDSSTTDRLMITGNTAGQSYVTVNNIGGNGARTAEGIKIIDVGGNSAGEFTLNGRAVAGAYEYFLYQGSASAPADGDWYLRTADEEKIPELRPESASYTANLAAANTLFVTTLADRSGETLYTDVFTGEEKSTSMWLRNEGSHNRSRDDSGELKTQDNRYVIQLGGDVAQWSRNAQDLWRVGVMAGYANSSSSSVAQGTGYRSNGSVDGYSVGMYGTWFAEGQDNTGAYVDTWLQYNWFNNQVDGQDLATEKYDSKGFTAAVESGYTFKVGESANRNYFIQPKAQVVWMGVKADSHTETNGTVVSGEGNNNIQTRLGAKAFISPIQSEGVAKGPTFKPYVEANWIHNTKDFGTTLDGITVKQAGAANIAELKLGAEGQVNNKLNLWGNVGQQLGNNGYSDSSITLGIKYNF